MTEIEKQTLIGWTIVSQMGGQKLIEFMTGAVVSVGSIPLGDELRPGAEIALPYQAHNEIDRVAITYDSGHDLYTMQGFSGASQITRVDWVYCEDLMDRFEEMTYLYLTLTPRRTG